MKISAITVCGLVSLGVCVTAAEAQEVTNYPNFQVLTQVHSTTGLRTAGPFVAASMMGAEGFSNVPPPLAADLATTITTISNNCKVQTNLLPQSSRNTDPLGPLGPGSVWPVGCNPEGMALALNASPMPPGIGAPHWIQVKYDSLSKTTALNAVYNSILTFKSPAIIPIYGVADHWMAIVDVRTTSGAVTHVRWIDSGPNDGETTDGVGNTYLGVGVATPTVLSNQYYQVLSSINATCDATGGCTQDPYYNKFVLMFEPPLGDNRHLPPVAFSRPPGVAPVMSEVLAQRYVWSAVTSAGANTEPEVQNMIATGVAGAATLVNAVYPDGSPWNYYLVPILSNTDQNSVIGYVQLAAADGSFENLNFLPHATRFSTITRAQAMSVARGMLVAGEHLVPGRLTWDPLIKTSFVKSPLRPYYEFEAVTSNGSSTSTGVIRVSSTDGTAERTP